MARFKLVEPINFLELKQAVNADLAEYSSDVAVKMVMNVVRPTVQEHYDNAVNQVSFKLRGLGMPAGVSKPGSRSISYGKVGGDTGRFRTKPWAALGERYAAKSPTSYKFWRKTGVLSHAFDTFVKPPFDIDVLERKASRNHHKNRINTKVLIGLEPLPFPFERGVTLPFLRGSDAGTMFDAAYPINRDGLGRARFAEQSGYGKGRPFLRKMSAYLGRQMLTDLTKKLRKL